MKSRNLLIIFTKNPRLGSVKTRLARDIGSQNALDIYRFLLQHSYEITTPVNTSKYVYYSHEVTEADLWDRGGFEKKLQHGNDLGERMENAFKLGFEEGFQKILIIGTDLYELQTKHIKEAFHALDHNDYVVGPAKDGGYYLLGMNSLNSDIFRNKKWSTSTVLQDTLKDMEGSRIRLLPTQNDIDVLEDIKDHPAFQKFIQYDRQN